MALVHRFILPGAAAAREDVFVAGVGLFTQGVLDIPVANTATISAVQTAVAAMQGTDAGEVDTSTASTPLVINGDPWPQYMRPADVVAAIQDPASLVSGALKAAYVSLPTPQQYGAKGDGITDDTAALKALLANNDAVYIPSAIGYKISAPLYDTPFTVPKWIYGDAYFGSSTQPASRIIVDHTAAWDPSKYVLHFADPTQTPGGLNGITIDNLQIAGEEGVNGVLQVPCNGIRFENVQHASIRNLYLSKIQGVSLDLATMFDSTFVNAKVMKGGDSSFRTVTIFTTAGSNVITCASGVLNQWDDYATVTGATGIADGSRILKASGAHGYETTTTAYLSAAATVTGTTTATVTRSCYVIKHRPFDGATLNNTNTINWIGLHSEANYAGTVLFGRGTRRVKMVSGKTHGLLNNSIATAAVMRFEGAYANQITGQQMSRTGRHQMEFDAYVDPVTLAADPQVSDANMVATTYYDSAGTAPGVVDGTAIRIIKGNRNKFAACQFEANDLNVVIDTGNTGNELVGCGLGMTGGVSNYQTKFSGPFTWTHIKPTTGDVLIRDEGSHWTTLLTSSTGVLAGGGGSGAQQSDIDTALQRALRITPARLETMPRQPANANIAGTSGVLHVVFTDALFDATAPVGFLNMVTAAGSNTALTLSRLAYFTRDASDNLTLIAFTADFHASIASATDFTIPLAAGTTLNGVTCPSTVSWHRGDKIAFGYLWTGTAHSSLRGTGSTTGPWTRPPRMAASVTGLTEIPATILATSFTDSIGAAYFSACSGPTG